VVRRVADGVVETWNPAASAPEIASMSVGEVKTSPLLCGSSE
jgi:hypothetical protein